MIRHKLGKRASEELGDDKGENERNSCFACMARGDMMRWGGKKKRKKKEKKKKRKKKRLPLRKFAADDGGLGASLPVPPSSASRSSRFFSFFFFFVCLLKVFELQGGFLLFVSGCVCLTLCICRNVLNLFSFFFHFFFFFFLQERLSRCAFFV